MIALRIKNNQNNSIMKDTFKKLFAFAVLCTAVLATICGTAYLFYDHHYLFGVTNICLAAMAFPYIKQKFLELIG